MFTAQSKFTTMTLLLHTLHNEASKQLHVTNTPQEDFAASKAGFYLTQHSANVTASQIFPKHRKPFG
jgi:hypothetical protein